MTTSNIEGNIENDSIYDETESFVLKDNSNIYILERDDNILFYSSDKDKTRNFMWELCRQNQYNVSTDYCTNIIYLSENELQIIGTYKWFAVTYEKVLHHFSITEVGEINNIIDSKHNFNSNQKRDTMKINIPFLRRFGFIS